LKTIVFELASQPVNGGLENFSCFLNLHEQNLNSQTAPDPFLKIKYFFGCFQGSVKRNFEDCHLIPKCCRKIC